MFNIENMLVLCGDMRCAYLAADLADSGLNVATYGFEKLNISLPNPAKTLREAVEQAKVVILPLPVSKDGDTLNAPFSGKTVSLNEVLNLTREGQIVFGGIFEKDLLKQLRDRRVKAFDYFEREELAIWNALPTSEGAIETAMRELPITLWGSQCLITGYGRIAKILQKSLTGLGAEVTAAARKYSDRAWISAMGSQSISIKEIGRHAHKFDVVFNTVPHEIIGKSVLQKLKKDVLVIDLASVPGGVDFEEAKKLNINVKWVLSVPGKVAPKTAGGIIKSAIMNVLEEENLCLN